MEVSKLTLSQNLKHQTSTQTKVLRWLQEHPKQCNNTNISKLSRMMSIEGSDFEQRKRILTNMVGNQVITRFGTKFSSRFLINYLHKDIPEEVLENAPPEEQKLIQKTLRGVQKGAKLEKNGTLITKPKGETKKPQIETEVNKDTNKISITITINLNKEN